MKILVLIFVVISTVQFYLGAAAKPGYCSKEVLRPKVNIVGSITYMPTMIEECCPGYALVRENCIPLCEDRCVNSNCTAPNTCSCYDGYKRVSTSRCEPICENCEKGFCLAPGDCKCFLRHKKDLVTGKCVPLCKSSCINGHCTDANVCTCNIGYHMSNKNAYTCIRNVRQEITATIEEATTEWEEMSSTTTPAVSLSSWGEERMASLEMSAVETTSSVAASVETETFITDDEEYPGYFDMPYGENVIDSRLSEIIESSTENFESSTESTSDQISSLENVTLLTSTEFTAGSSLTDETKFITEHGLTDSITVLKVFVNNSVTIVPDTSSSKDSILYILLGAFIVLFIICMITLVLVKHSKKISYNIAAVEKTKGVANYSTKQGDVTATWEIVQIC